jgi:hypothetical protein
MYYLLVFCPSSRVAHEEHSIARGADVLTRIPELLDAHTGCERIAVYVDYAYLFAVDCKGNRLQG